MAFCMNCGAQLPANAKFCFECGAKQERIEKSKPAKKEKPYVAVFDDEEESGYYEEEDGSDFSSAYNKEIPSQEPAPAKASPIQKQTVAETPVEVHTEDESEEEFEEEPEEDVFEPVFAQAENVASSPEVAPVLESNIEENVEEEAEFDEDEIDEENLVEKPAPKKVDMSQLSSYLQDNNVSAETKSFGLNSKTLKPVTDPYWDDVKPEIDDEIYKIDRSIIFKGIGIVAALFALIVYLIYML